MIGLTREERIDLAEQVLRRDFTSWKQLDDDQVNRMLDVLEGHILINYLIKLRGGPLPPRHTASPPPPDRR